MYEPFLLIHSWMRWLLVVALIYFLGRCLWGWAASRRPTVSDSQFLWMFDQMFGYQVLFGLTLWFAGSPFIKSGLQNPSQILSDPTISFWVVRHPLTMIFALVVFKLGKGVEFRRADGSARAARFFKYYSVLLLGLLFIMATAMPWSYLEYGRSWFRGFE